MRLFSTQFKETLGGKKSSERFFKKNAESLFSFMHLLLLFYDCPSQQVVLTLFRAKSG